MTRVVLVVGKRSTGKTTYAKENTSNALVLAHESYANEWKGHRVVSELREDTEAAEFVVWEANMPVAHKQFQDVLHWCTLHNVFELQILVQREQTLPGHAFEIAIVRLPTIE